MSRETNHISVNLDHEKGLEENASCLSKLFVTWFYPVLRLGAKQKLEPSDLGGISPQDEPELCYQRFNQLWVHELARSERTGKSPSMKSIMAKFVGFGTLSYCLFLMVVQTTLQTLTPLISKAVIETLTFEDQLESDPDFQGAEPPLDDVTKWIAVAALTTFPFLAALCQAKIQQHGMRATIHMYAALTTAIFRKSLVLSATARSQTDTGNIVNLMTSDAGTSIERSVVLLFPFAVALPQLCVLVYLLYDLIGATMFVGIAVIVAVIPFNAVIFKTIVSVYKKLMVATDKRVKLVNEMLSTIRVLKMYAWERPFMKNIAVARANELRYIRKHAYWFTIGLTSVFLQVPNILMTSVLAVLYFRNDVSFNPATVGTAIMLFQLIRQPLTVLPNAISALTQASVALGRIATFLQLDEMKMHGNDIRSLELPTGRGEPVIAMADASFAWIDADVLAAEVAKENKEVVKPTKTTKRANKKRAKAGQVVAKEDDTPEFSVGVSSVDLTQPVLSDCNFKIARGQLVAVVGPVGQGKSSLLQAILGEVHKTAGVVTLQGTVSYAAQLPWIVNATLRDNVLFGERFDERRYQQTIEACALLSDIAMFDGGDEIVIGERGINLSGGQKARINLARAVYSSSDIIVMDDPLAAVDAHVGNHIFDTCIKGFLKGRTRVLVTNQVHRLKHMDRILYVDGGRVVFDGTFAQLQVSGINYSFEQAQAQSKAGAPNTREAMSGGSAHGARSVSTNPANPEEEHDGNDVKHETEEAADLYVEEARESGNVKKDVFVYYCKTVGLKLLVVSVLLNQIAVLGPVAAGYMLTFLTDEEVVRLTLCQGPVLTGNETLDDAVGDLPEVCDTFLADTWMFAHIGIVGASLLFCILGAVAVAESRVKSAKIFHENLAAAIVRAPVAFFDVTPLGRVINRFSRDMSQVDNQLTQMLLWVVISMSSVFASFVGILIPTQGYFLVVLLPVMVMYNFIYQKCRTSGLQMQRIQSVTRSPIYSNFSEVLSGVSTIRAYHQKERFQDLNKKFLRKNLVSFYLVRAALPAWITVNLNILGMLISGSVAIFVVLATDLITASNAGLALTYSMSVMQMLYNSVFILTEAEVMMNSVERLKEYTEDVEPEAPLEIEDTKPDDQWPSTGEIAISNLRAGYRDGPDVIKGISLTVRPMEKIGVVGRTGSGKSTLMQVLLRVIEPRDGTIFVDGIDITTIGLEDLRTKISIIPQDPVCFVGSVRFNLDPFKVHTDAAIWEALEKVNLHGFVSQLPGKLDEMVAENGENLSMGQRQLLSIARAILRPSRILLLDEATASVDKGTDQELQNMIRVSFKERTVLTIAHRLNTIMDSDRILVLGDGNVLEFDAPARLMANTSGTFYDMVKSHS